MVTTNDWLVLIIFIITLSNLMGIIVNVKLLDEDTEGTLLYQIWNNNMNLFGKLLLTFIWLISIPIWAIPELLIRLLKWLCYIGKRRKNNG